MGNMTRTFQHAALVIGGLGMTLILGGCSALESLTNGNGQSSGTYDESRDARSASGRYDDTTYDRTSGRSTWPSRGGYDSSSSSGGYGSSGRYDSTTGRYDSTPGSNEYDGGKAQRSADQYNGNGQDRTYEERKAARQRDQYNNGY
jgi:hypothetical protein